MDWGEALQCFELMSQLILLLNCSAVLLFCSAVVPFRCSAVFVVWYHPGDTPRGRAACSLSGRRRR